MTVVEREMIITNPCGVHSRVAARIARVADEVGVGIHLRHKGRDIDCRSILDVLSMALTCGTRLVFSFHGDQVSIDKAVSMVEELIAEAESS